MDTYELTLTANPGALAHVVALITGRRWTLGSLHYPEAFSADRRLITFALDSGGRSDQVLAQFRRLYDVLSIRHLPPGA